MGSTLAGDALRNDWLHGARGQIALFPAGEFPVFVGEDRRGLPGELTQ